MARITKTSMISGITRTLEMKQYTQEEFERRYYAWNTGKLLIQEAFPEVSDSAREFIKTGIIEAEWNDSVSITSNAVGVQDE